MSYETLSYEVSDGVGRITLDRPDSFNAMSCQMAKDLMDTSILMDEDPNVRAVLITGKGKAFCAGGDLVSFSKLGDELPGFVKEMTVYLHAAVSRLNRMDAPVIAAVNGVAAGAGMSLVCATDLAIGSESSAYTMAYTLAGLSPDGSGTYFVSRLVGMRRAKELALTNRKLTSAEALDWGVLNQVVPDADLMTEANALAVKLAAGPTRAYGNAKRLIMEGTSASLETQMQLEAEGIAAMMSTHDGREGIDAFVSKRKPAFTGE
jgi:2-(1,2-epoxy-1,2-dihydrophenyl)acetyl-CoA isomerase